MKTDLSGATLLIASPLYGGMCHATYKNSQIGLVRALMDYGVGASFKDCANQADIRKARNELALEAYSDERFTHLLFWDGDIGIAPRSIIDMLALDLDVVAAPCPMKAIDWRRVREALARNPNLTDAELEGLSGKFCFNQAALGEYELDIDLAEPTEMLDQGAGVMLIKVSALFRLIGYRPDEWYYENRTEPRGRKVYDLFPAGVEKETRTYNTEDYAFVRLWQSVGGKVWMCPWVRTTHAGTHVFRGNLVDMVRHLAEPAEEKVGS
jgi:hypothetical protein